MLTVYLCAKVACSALPSAVKERFQVFDFCRCISDVIVMTQKASSFFRCSSWINAINETFQPIGRWLLGSTMVS